MSQTIGISNVSEFMTRHFVDVFETMLALKATLTPDVEPPAPSERVSACVGFGGDDISGTLYLHLSVTLARSVAGAMLGLPPEEALGDAEVNDVVGELTNMLTGGLKSWLSDAGADCAMSTPGVIRGVSYSIEPMTGVQRLCWVFACGAEQAVVELHLKLTGAV